MKKTSAFILGLVGFIVLILIGIILLAIASPAGAQVIPVANQFIATTSPTTAITQAVYGRSFRLSGQGSGCAQFDGNGVLTSTGSVCGSGGGGSGTVTSILTNNGITGGPITTTGTIGLDTSLFSNNALLTWNGSKLAATGTPSLTVGNLIATSTATSTFTGGISTNLLSVTSTTASSTFSNGINLTKGCFAINGTCVTGGGSSLTGTTGQVAYFSGTNNAVGTSTLFISAAGNVGVGTTTPTSKLDVVGNDAQALTIDDATSPANAIHLFGGRIDTNRPDGLYFQYGKTAPSLFSTNVGIGTLSPDAPLEVSGTVTGDGNSVFHITNNNGSGSINALTIWPDSAQGVKAILGDGSTGAIMDFNNFAQFGRDNSTDLFFATQSSERMRFDSSGNTEIENGALSIGGDAGSHSYLQDTSALGFGGGGLSIVSNGQNGNGDPGFVLNTAGDYSTTPDVPILDVQSAGSSYMQLKTYGSFAHVLEVEGSASLGFNSTLALKDADGNNSVDISWDVTNNKGVFSTYLNAFPFEFNGSENIFNPVNDTKFEINGIQKGVVTSTGLGLGTTSPGTILSVGNAGGINFNPVATSTFGSSAAGINILKGCYAINGTCITGGGGTTYTAAWPITLTGTTFGFNGLSTSSAAVIGNIPYFSGANTFANVATSTVTASSPLTGSFVTLGSGGSVGCQTASGSQAGCLSSTDWTTFNNKQATISGGTVGKVARWTSASTLSTGKFLDDGTETGVNATSSAYTFNVQGNQSQNPFNVASSTGTSLLNLDQSGNLVLAGSLSVPSQVQCSGSVFCQIQSVSTDIDYKVVDPTKKLAFTVGNNDILTVNANGLGVGTTTNTVPNSTLQVAGSVSATIVVKSGNYTLNAGDYTVEETSGASTVTLPTAVGITGRMYVIKDATASTMTLNTTSSQTIFTTTAVTSITMAAGASYTVQSDGSNWIAE